MSAVVNSDNGNYDVHLGFWINWSLGKMQGATFTTTKESGGLLIAFIALITTNSANEVLLTGKNCGILYRGVQTEEMQELYMKTSDLNEEYSSQRSAAYLNYASQCYPSSRAEQSESCRPYIKPKLNYTITRNASCPFDDAICLLKSENLVLDTGLLDSHNDFGINSPKNKRFAFRVKSQCAPLVTEGFSKVHHPEDPVYDPAVRFYYGEALGVMSHRDKSFTYQVPYNVSSRSIANYTSMQSPHPDYIIGTATDQFFTPIPQISRPDGELALIFLSAPGVLFPQPIDDVWFAAHAVAPGVKMYYGNDTEGTPAYERDEPVGVMGCVSQYQFCNPSLPAESQCQPLASSNNSYWEPSEELWSDKNDQEFVKWGKNVLFASFALSPNNAYVSAGISALLVRANLKAGLQSGEIANNQWQLEIAHAFEVMLASLQGSFLDNTNGPLSPEYAPAFARPNDTAWRYMCENQKIVSALYYSFNILGLAIILIIGGIFIILENTLEAFVNWIDRRPSRRNNPRATYARLEWQSNATLQLHRLAYEEAGYGTWYNCTGTVPVTEPGEKLGILDVRDKKHSRIEHAGWRLQTVVTDETIVDTDNSSARKVEVDITRVESQEEEDGPKRESMCISPVSSP
ncbi:hypothetical protein N0V90_009132 [Kalmusia sp. IMI 367209]|nr:hypothetical protein N0V90_009132 [Kalmusia sp. IMI 367209]